MASNRAMMFIDGSNLFHVVRSIQVEEQETHYRVDFRELRKQVCEVINAELLRIYYFASAPADVSQEQTRFFHKLEYSGIRVILSELRNTAEGYREKGVDVNIACKTIVLSEYFDICVLLTHDQDLIPAVEALQDKGKTVALFGFMEHMPSRLKRAVDLSFDMTRMWEALRVNDAGKANT